MGFDEDLSVHADILYKSAEHTPSLSVLPALKPFNFDGKRIN